MSKNLWPKDLVISEVRSPVSILREQAAFLEKNTDNVISAVVTPAKGKLGNILDVIEPSNSFSYNFYITAPVLGNYRYLLLGIFYGLELYPVTIFLGDDIKKELDFGSENPVVETEKEFEACLARIFNSSKARKVVSALLSQVVDN